MSPFPYFLHVKLLSVGIPPLSINLIISFLYPLQYDNYLPVLDRGTPNITIGVNATVHTPLQFSCIFPKLSPNPVIAVTIEDNVILNRQYYSVEMNCQSDVCKVCVIVYVS